MFKPEWHRDGRNHWSKLDSTGKSLSVKPPIQLWKEKGLRFPPGYKEVWVDLKHKKTPVRFLDQEDRVQYQYWPDVLKKNRNAHWSRLHLVGSSLYNKLDPLLKKSYPEKGEDWTRDDIVRLMVRSSLECGIRPGHPKYRDANNSFGISTLEMRHIKAKPSWSNPQSVVIKFPGKKQVLNECEACSTKKSQWRSGLLSYIDWRRRQGQTGSGELFWVQPETNSMVHPEQMNEWLQTNVHPEVKMKDLRTWLVHRHALEELSKLNTNEYKTEKDRKQAWKDAITEVAAQTHHTPSICQSSYLHPKLKECWLSKTAPFERNRKVNEKRFLLGLWKNE